MDYWSNDGAKPTPPPQTIHNATWQFTKGWFLSKTLKASSLHGYIFYHSLLKAVIEEIWLFSTATIFVYKEKSRSYFALSYIS